jgi:hypothetical protein
MAISSKVPATMVEISSAISAVNCPKCGAAIPITEALSHQAREQVSRDFELKRQQMEQQFAERERKLEGARDEIEKARAKMDEELKSRLQAERSVMVEGVRRELEAQKGHELTALQEQLARKTKQMEEANEKQLQLLRQKADLEDRERALKLETQKELDAVRGKVQHEVAVRLEKEKADIAVRIRQEIETGQANELKLLKEQLAQRSKQIDEANKKQLDLLREKADLEDQKRALDLTVAQQLSAERANIAEQARAQALDESRLKLAEKEKLTDDLRKQIETLQQKATQGSVQAQGEVLELDFEAKLRAEFPFDEIAPVSTGQRGADVRQVVRTSPTNICGTVLWEMKRTRAWSAGWIPKLKTDQREAKAEIAVIVTQTLPKEVAAFGCVDGVWVSDFESALPLGLCLRQQLVQVSAVRQAENGKVGKMEELYKYMTSTEFVQQILAMVDAFKAMSADLDAERNALEKIWAKREKQLRSAARATVRLYGSVQAVTGAAALPDIPALALPSGD